MKFCLAIFLLLECNLMIHAFISVVIYHGMGDTADESPNYLKNYLENKLPGIYVTSIKMGHNSEEDFLSGYFMNLNKQVERSCAIIREDAKLKDGYNAIGLSQGGQIIRAIAQRCPDPPMRNLISLGGQHQGVYGLPNCVGSIKICNYIRKMIHFGVYLDFVQNNIVQAEYWHDPLQENMYREKSVFLADINNERIPRNESYKTNLLKLQNLVLVIFWNDTIVQPKESGWFEFYVSGQVEKIYKLRDSPLYKEDWIGLKQLDQENKLIFLGSEGNHLQFDIKWFQENIVEPYLSK